MDLFIRFHVKFGDDQSAKGEYYSCSTRDHPREANMAHLYLGKHINVQISWFWFFCAQKKGTLNRGGVTFHPGLRRPNANDTEKLPCRFCFSYVLRPAPTTWNCSNIDLSRQTLLNTPCFKEVRSCSP